MQRSDLRPPAAPGRPQTAFVLSRTQDPAVGDKLAAPLILTHGCGLIWDTHNTSHPVAYMKGIRNGMQDQGMTDLPFSLC
ncbi:hypothetical protein V2G26_006649 [Clonostachys chloroleuca]